MSHSKLFDLTGKVAVVTGAANGIGAQTAKDLAQLGAIVIATDLEEEGLTATAQAIENEGGHAMTMKHDVTLEDDWAAAVRSSEQEFGRLDVLVNNAGIMLHLPFAECRYQDFQRQMHVNVDSVFIGCKAAYNLMEKSAKSTEGSSIINLSSIYGQVVGPMHSAYCASKGAVRLLTKSLAVEFGYMQSGIRVNSVHPGPTTTELGLAGLRKLASTGAVESFDSGYQNSLTMFPMGRWGEVGDISGVIAFLASDASKYVTGTELVVDGGFTCQ